MAVVQKSNLSLSQCLRTLYQSKNITLYSYMSLLIVILCYAFNSNRMFVSLGILNNVCVCEYLTRSLFLWLPFWVDTSYMMEGSRPPVAAERKVHTDLTLTF